MAKAKRVVARVEQDPQAIGADTVSASVQATEAEAATATDGKQASAQAEPKKDKAASAAAAPAKKRAPKARVAVDPATSPEPEAPRPKAAKAKAASGAAQQPAGREARTPSTGGLMGRISAIAPGHEGAFLGGLLGLVVALLAFAIGPGRTLVVLLFVIVGVTVGQILDGDTRLVSLVQRLLRGGDED